MSSFLKTLEVQKCYDCDFKKCLSFDESMYVHSVILKNFIAKTHTIYTEDYGDKRIRYF